jgi:hypothetical protein
MLVKWAIEGRRKTAAAKVALVDNYRQGDASDSVPASGAELGGQDRPQTTGEPVEPETTAHALTAQLDRLNYEKDVALARSFDNDGDRTLRRIHAQERDKMLRDNKLLALTGPQILRHNSHPGQESIPSMPLTEENIEKLVHEQDIDISTSRKSPDENSSMINQGYSQSDLGTNIARPQLPKTLRHGSERTITKDSPV